MDNNDAQQDQLGSRRSFLTKVGQLGGAAALYETMVALGLLNLPSAWAGIPKLPPDHGLGKSVLILGAGIGGLTTAYILSRSGYHCRILEATSRAGGRNLTARRGTTVIEQSKEHGTTHQECRFDDGLYLNLGPGRIPYHHRRVLGYCQELGVKLEPYLMNTTSNLFQSDQGFDGKPVPYRQIQNDTRGHIADLLAKAVNQAGLDESLDGADKKKLLELLVTFGALDEKTRYYKGTTRDGCTQPPDVDQKCEPPAWLDLDELLASNFWDASFYNRMEFEWQSTLFQPTGGMDMIVEGFLRKIDHLITYDAPVTNIQVDADGVTVSYQEGSTIAEASADYCASNIPCSILKTIPNNFEGGFKEAVNSVKFASSCKVGWQSNTRFWENDPYDIYGGISWTDDIIEQIWYPSNDYFGQKGTLTGAYIHDLGPYPEQKHATIFGNYDLEERLRVAKRGGTKLHPEIADEDIVPSELGLSIAWQHIPSQQGAWADWGNSDDEHEHYTTLLSAYDDRFFVVGDQVSQLPGWQEGAMMSAEHVARLITNPASPIIPETTEAPNTFKVIHGHR